MPPHARSAASVARALAGSPWALACWLGVAGGARRNDGRARILMLHGTPRSRADALERMLRYLRRHFHVVPLAEVVAALDAGPSVEPRFRRHLALTFDDGLANNVEVAWPLLRALNLPATFFICPGLAERGQWLWNHEARERLRSLPAGARAELALELGAPQDVEGLVDWLKAQALPARRRAEARIREATPRFAPSAAQRHAFDVAGWEALETLDPGLVTLGAHTLTHPILTSLAPEEAEREIVGSRRALEARLGRPARFFAYPNGNVDSAIHACVRRHFDAALSVAEGFVEPGCDPCLLPRLSAPWSVLRLARALHRAPAPGAPAALPMTA